MTLAVITGGARSGKSRVAQGLAEARGREVAIVTFGRGADDTEMAERIARHRDDRPAHWKTIEPEAAWGWMGAVTCDDVLVVDCLGTLVGRLMEEVHADLGIMGAFGEVDEVPEGFASELEARQSRVLQGLLGRGGDTIVVTNEVGDGLVPAYALGRLFRDCLGRANRVLVDAADAAWLVVAGRCLDLAALPQEARWPDARGRMMA